MHAEVHPWETALLSLAHEAHSAAGAHQSTGANEELLDEAYRFCERFTAENSRSFHMASSLLPAEKRRAVRALYAFCRVTDDIVDGAQSDEAVARLEAWRRVTSTHQPVDDMVALAWGDARHRFHVPARYAEQLIDGVARDLNQTRYSTFDELASYSYGVASTVGLMSMHIVGFAGATALPYAIKLGVALQLTNILRDVGEDWRNGRVYLPRGDMAAFGLDEGDLARGVVTERWRKFMRFQIARNRRLYAEARPGIGLLNRDGRVAIAAAADLYQAILVRIEMNDYDNFSRRAVVPALTKISMLPGIWLRSRRA